MSKKPGRRYHDISRYYPALPAAALVIIFLFGPIIWSLYSSLTNSSTLGAATEHSQFTGLSNYVTLFKDPTFPKSVILTIVFIVASAIVGQNVLGMVIALLSRHARATVSKAVGLMVLLAWVIPDVVGCYCAYAFFAQGGTLSIVGKSMGLDLSGTLYLHPMTAIIIANIWRGTAFSMLMYEAALNDISPEIVEAAHIDGAGALTTFFRVKLPLIKQSVLTNLMLTTLQTLSVFTLILVMTGGGPGTNSTTLPVFAYQQAFKFSKLGYGTAISVMLILIGSAFSLIYMRLLKGKAE